MAQAPLALLAVSISPREKSSFGLASPSPSLSPLSIRRSREDELRRRRGLTSRNDGDDERRQRAATRSCGDEELRRRGAAATRSGGDEERRRGEAAIVNVGDQTLWSDFGEFVLDIASVFDATLAFHALLRVEVLTLKRVQGV